MSVVYLKLFKEVGRTELSLAESLEDLTVKELQEKVSEKIEIPQDELALVYAGRVLKPKNTVSQYRVVSGCTLFVMRRPPKTPVPETESEQATGFNALIGNRRVLTVIGRVLSNPSLLQAMLAGTPLEGNQALRDTLSDPELLSSLSDPDTIQEYLKDNPHMAAMMESILRVYHLIFGEGGSGAEGGSGERGEEAVEMIEGSLEDDIEDAQQERIRMAQEEMFEHSQALHAHQQQRQTQAVASSSQHPPVIRPVQESSTNQAMSRPYGSVQRQDSGSGITQGQLASALAEAMNRNSPQQPSSLSSLDMASGPPSLSAYSNQLSTSATPVQSSNRTGVSTTEQAGTVTGQQPVSSEALQQALATAISNIPTPSSSQEPEDRMTLREKYMAQLEQMHTMGILDDVVSIQALEATGGDLQSALEIIYTR